MSRALRIGQKACAANDLAGNLEVPRGSIIAHGDAAAIADLA